MRWMSASLWGAMAMVETLMPESRMRSRSARLADWGSASEMTTMCFACAFTGASPSKAICIIELKSFMSMGATPLIIATMRRLSPTC